MSQTSLFNYRSLSTTREIKSVQFAREKAASPSSRSATLAVSEPSTLAIGAVAAVRKPIASPPSYRDAEAEFNLPDEDRVLRTLDGVRQCPACGEMPVLKRNHSLRRNMYRVGCPASLNLATGEVPDWRECPDPTPWFDSSGKAVNFWRLIQKLSAR